MNKPLGEIENAIIKSTSLGVEDHGIMTIFLHLEYDGAGQAFGGYALDSWNPEAGKRVPSVVMAEHVTAIMEAVGVDKWEDLRGKHIRADHSNIKVFGIGHFMKDKWFYPGKGD